MTRPHIFAATVLAALFANAAGAQEVSNDTFKAADLALACNLPAVNDQAARDFAEQTCHAYLRGITDGLFLMRMFAAAGKAGCLPLDTPISNSEARAEFNVFLLAHPDMAQNSAGLVAAAAIIQAHPC
jgi:hypothetical protein